MSFCPSFFLGGNFMSRNIQKNTLLFKCSKKCPLFVNFILHKVPKKKSKRRFLHERTEYFQGSKYSVCSDKKRSRTFQSSPNGSTCSFTNACISNCSVTNILCLYASIGNFSSTLTKALSSCLSSVLLDYWKTNTPFASVINGSNVSFVNSSITSASILNLSKYCKFYEFLLTRLFFQ